MALAASLFFEGKVCVDVRRVGGFLFFSIFQMIRELFKICDMKSNAKADMIFIW